MTLELKYDPYLFRAECYSVESGKKKKIKTNNPELEKYLDNCFIFEVCINEFLEELNNDSKLGDTIEFKGTKQDYELLKAICQQKYKYVECKLLKSLGDVNPFSYETMEEIIQASTITASAIALGKENKEYVPKVAVELLEYIEKTQMEDCVKSMVLFSNLTYITKELELNDDVLINEYSKASFSKIEGLTIYDLKDFNVAVIETNKTNRNLGMDILNSSAYLFAKFNVGTLSIFENAIDFAVGGAAKLFKNKELGKKLFENQITKKANDALDKKMDVPVKVKKAGRYVYAVGDAASRIGLVLLGGVGVAGAIASGTILGLGTAGETVKKAAEKTGEYGNKEYLCGLAVGAIVGTLPTIIGFVSGHITKLAGTVSGKVVESVISKGGSAAAVKAAQVGVGLGGAAVVGAASSLIYSTKDITEEVLFKITGIKDKIEIDIKKIAINVAIGIGISCTCYLISAIPVLMKDNKELQKTIDAYREELLKASECPETIGTIDKNGIVQQPSNITRTRRIEFADNKAKLREEWENLHGKPWPKYEEDVYLNGKPWRLKGENYDAHHIQPLCLGGKNTAENITPLNVAKHAEIHNVAGNKYSAMVSLKEKMQAADYVAKYANKGTETLAGEMAKEAMSK